MGASREIGRPSACLFSPIPLTWQFPDTARRYAVVPWVFRYRLSGRPGRGSARPRVGRTGTGGGFTIELGLAKVWAGRVRDNAGVNEARMRYSRADHPVGAGSAGRTSGRVHPGVGDARRAVPADDQRPGKRLRRSGAPANAGVRRNSAGDLRRVLWGFCGGHRHRLPSDTRQYRPPPRNSGCPTPHGSRRAGQQCWRTSGVCEVTGAVICSAAARMMWSVRLAYRFGTLSA